MNTKKSLTKNPISTINRSQTQSNALSKLQHTISSKIYRVRSKNIARLLFLIDSIGSLFFKKRNFPSNIENILIISVDHIGDMVLNGAFTKNLKLNFLKAKITILSRSSVKPIAELLTGIDEIIALNTSWHSRNDSDGKSAVDKFIKNNKNKFDLVFELHAHPKSLMLAKKVGKFTVAHGIRGFRFLIDKEAEWGNEIKHTNQRKLDLLRAINLKIKDEKLELNNPEKNSMKKKLEELNILSKNIAKDKLVFIQISPGTTAKEWPLENWKILIKDLIKRGNKIITADLDKEKVEIIINSLNKEELKHFYHIKTSLKEYVALISLSNKVITTDTLATHIASAFNISTITIFSGTNIKEEWAPLAKNSISFQDRSCPLWPCGLQICAYKYPSPCMEKITNLESL